MLSPPLIGERGPYLDAPFQIINSYQTDDSSELAMCSSAYARPQPTIYWIVEDKNGNEIKRFYPTKGHFRFCRNMN